MSTRAEIRVNEQGTTTGRLRSNRLFAVFWDWAVRHESKRAREIRKSVVSQASGRVLEIGCGTGGNFRYYAEGTEIVGTEPDSEMLKRAQRHVEDEGLIKVELRRAAAEALPFEDASFDYVVSGWVFCHIDDVPHALGEVKRLVKPGGAFLFMEHVRDDDSRLWRTAQDWLNPIWRRLLGAGCSMNRRTQQAIEDAGFSIERLEQAPTGPLTSPTIYGLARAIV